MPFDFMEDGSLVPGRHEVSVAEIETELVEAFPGSATRRSLFASYLNVRAAIGKLVTVKAQWLDGSYVTRKQDPNDIDVVTIIDGAEVEALDAVDQTLLKGLVWGHASQAIHGCDSFWVTEYPEGHPNHHVYLRGAAYWDRWWGQDRDGNAKGYLEVK